MPPEAPSPDWRQDLLDWYRAEKREMPWRRTRDPYAIWVSEVMLQQTQVATVVDYWLRWMDRFPTVESLASADEQEVLALWAGLGYYQRARRLQAGAKWVCENGLPQSREDWLSVPGIGPYTSAAIASIAQEEPVALVDGNVERVFARMAAFTKSGRELHQAAWKWAEENLRADSPGDWNQALMELGATVCAPKAPKCMLCPALSACEARRQNLHERLPAPEPKPETVRLERSCRVLVRDGQIGLRQIPKGQWWEGMWAFPDCPPTDEDPFVTVRHAVTKHRITLSAYWGEGPVEAAELRFVSPSEAAELALPAAQKKVLRAALAKMQGNG